MSNHTNLVFFNKEGDALSYGYNIYTDRFEGDIMFHENSTDTYKTFGLYTMEKVPAFEFEAPGSLTLDKFQLFNEWGLHFYGGNSDSFPVVMIEPVNNDPGFYSKWIFGFDFDGIFPIGTQIRFNTPFLEFSNTRRTYTVVGNKMNAILIISDLDNKTFEDNYSIIYNSSGTFESIDNNSRTYKIFISSVNCIGIYNYIDSNLQNNLSNWSEPNFYEKIYNNQKLNVINSKDNNDTFTVINSELNDAVCYEYFLPTAPQNKTLVIEYTGKSELTQVYNGSLSIDSNGKILLDTVVPSILKPGTEFKIIGSNLNTNFLRVSSLTDWSTLKATTTFKKQSIVLYKNKMYECVTNYTHDFSDPIISRVTPLDRSYWIPSYTIPIDGIITTENLASAQIYLTTDKLYFTQQYTENSTTTFGLAVENYANDLKSLNIDLHMENGVLRAALIYPSNYASIRFYDSDSSSIDLGDVLKTNERLIEVKENLKTELNYNISENFLYNIVFTDIDYFGIKIQINKEIYQEEAALIGTGNLIDIERSIDKTLRNWLVRHYLALHLLGIECELTYVGSGGSVFYNTIVVKSFYPNVPININKIEVGTNADFHIEHTRVLFSGTQSIGASININVNGKEYEESTEYNTNTKIPDIPKTLNNWLDSHSETLEKKGLYVSSINNMLKFDIKRTDINFEIGVKNGKLIIPGQREVIITKRIKGSLGTLITSNSIVLPSDPNNTQIGLRSSGFSSGMIISLNNTIYPYVNYEFKAQYVSEERVSLSYEGPFWGLTDSLCNSSPYVTIAFNSGFGATACVTIPTITQGGGPFDHLAFDQLAFTKYKYTTQYTTKGLNLSSTPGSSNMVDIKYIQLADSVFVLADNLIVIDAIKYEYVTHIELLGNSNSIKLEYNTYNNYLYCLSKNYIWVVDPVINILITKINLSNNAYDLVTNPINGDIYVSYDNDPDVEIYDYTNNLITKITTTGTKTGMMIWNSYSEEVFITSDSDKIYVIKGDDRTLKTTYNISNLEIDKIYYEPVNESVYFWDSSSLNKIENEILTSINTIVYDTFKDIIYNNITGEINISSQSGFKSIELGNDSLNINESLSGDYGYMTINQFDGNVYLSSLTSVVVVNPGNGWAIGHQYTTSPGTKIIYNPSRKSVWTIQPGIQSIFEVFADVDTSVVLDNTTSLPITNSMYGTLSEGYTNKNNLWVKTREFYRRPRENYKEDTQVSYYWEWYDDQTPEFFLYDTTGDQLPTTGSYSYTGPKPLGEVPLNKLENRDQKRRSLPEFQQTIFNKITHKLKYLDDDATYDSEDLDIKSDYEPLQTFLGFKAPDEGAYITSLHLYKKEEIDFSITSTAINDTIIGFATLIDNYNNRIGEIRINNASAEVFTGRGLKPGQIIRLELVDITNTTKQYNSLNTGSYFRIKNVYSKSITVSFFKSIDYIDSETTVIADYPTQGQKTYLKARFSILDREIGKFRVMGQSEDEDIRFKINLNNIGKNIMPEDIYIFKDYDIKEGGVDWKFLNIKRKEMLMHKNIIFTYIGAYKSIINAINYFGYNDLQLNEYYRNVDASSKDFSKLFKVEIPDVFDNSVVGWNEKDFLKNTMPNEKFEETNLFNLTYDITDKDGNNLLNYTLEEISLKLQGLKFWLSKNIIPLTHKILDITGKTYFGGSVSINHTHTQVKSFKIRSNSSPISFKLTEAYLMPINSGSTVYNCVLDFYSIIPNIGAEKSTDYQPSKEYIASLPDYYNIKIRTWKTYTEWVPFTTYSKGDRVLYYDKLYESAIDRNRLLNPKKYELVDEWSLNLTYDETNITKYKNRIYAYRGTIDSNKIEVNPFNNQGDSGNWLDITEWIEVSIDPVQTINEFRSISATQSGRNPILPFNFTIDSNIDPYITIEVSSDDGYGGLYTDKKNYEIRGIKDLFNKVEPIEKIGPFNPIKYLPGLSTASSFI